jgi:transposase-like protein
MPVHCYPQEMKERARRWYADGMGLSDIAGRLEVGVSTIKTWTKGLPRQQPWKGRQNLPPEMRSEALRLARQGMGFAEIARRIGVSRQAVCYWVGQDKGTAEAAPSHDRYRITDPALALALSGAWR